MLFNSIDFAIFLPIVFVLYWFVTSRNLKLQNLFLIAASYLFYGWWDWRFLFLLMFSTTLDYSVGRAMGSERNEKIRRILLRASIIVNLGFLGFFKYYNFFADSFVSAFTLFGHDITPTSLHIILPVGISFYTFQSLSYAIDTYKRKLEPTKDFIAFSAFVSFFPQLVAGPIERATHMLPQFVNKRTFDYNKAVDGLRQMLWGLFKKIVIADNSAKFANMIFDQPDNYAGSTLLLGAVFFTFQIYADFSGYSDIALGTARLLGFELMRNFNFPYFSRDVAEFWRRWHISLSTWFRDYLYYPLGGSRGNIWMKIRNTFIVFIVSGFWHGANWTFIIWGALNALYFLPLLLTNNNRNNLDLVAQGKLLPSMRELGQMLFTFGLTVVTWIFFRATSVEKAFDFIRGVFSTSLFTIEKFYGAGGAVKTLILIAFFMIVEWLGRDQQFAIARSFCNRPRPVRWIYYMCLIFAIIYFQGEQQGFIYFQF